MLAPGGGEGGAASRAEAMAVPGGGRAQLAHCGRCQGATHKQQLKEEKPGSNTQTTVKGGEAREQHTVKGEEEGGELRDIMVQH